MSLVNEIETSFTNAADIDPSRAVLDTRTLCAVALVLMVLHFAILSFHFTLIELPWLFRSLFDLDEEQSFGTWYSAILLLCAALSVRRFRHRPATENSLFRYRLVALEVGFILLSADEIVGLHETLNTLTPYSWAIYALPPLLLLAAMFVTFVFQFVKSTAVLLISSAIIYIGGAVGIEFVSDIFEELDMLNTLSYALATGIEEGMEMLGVVLFIWAMQRARFSTER